MRRNCFLNFILGGVNITSFGLQIPSPFCSLELSNSEITSFTSWKLVVTVGGDDSRKVNIAAFEALLYSAAQTAAKESTESGIPVSFMFGWLDEKGSVSDYLSYQGTTIKFSSSCSGMFTTYNIEGYASLALKSVMPVLNIPEITGLVQPSAILVALAKAVKADTWYDLDIDRTDSPVYISHGAMCTSFSDYVRGNRTGQDNYEWAGLLQMSKSYNATREAAGLKTGAGRLSAVLSCIENCSIEEIYTKNSASYGTAAHENRIISQSPEVGKYLKKSLTDNTPQCGSYVFWIEEPTMTRRGIIHYKERQSVMAHEFNTLRYGTSNSNVLSISGSYNGIAYNISDMNFSYVGFNVDGSGQTIVNDATVVNGWSNDLAEVFQTASIINDINALATQFSGDFTVTVPGSTKQFTVCEPVSLVVMSGNTLSPVSGIYNIVSVTHSISTTFITTLKLQRLAISSATQTAIAIGIYAQGSRTVYGDAIYETTSNIKTPYLVDLGNMYPTMLDYATGSIV